MLYVMDLGGVIRAADASSINQGESGASEIVLLAPYPSFTSVRINVRLPNKLVLPPVAADPDGAFTMELLHDFNDFSYIKNSDGDLVGYNAWKYTVRYPITQTAGNVTISFVLTTPSGAEKTSTSVVLPINSATPSIPVAASEDDITIVAAYVAQAAAAATNAEGFAEGAAVSQLAAQEAADAASYSAMTAGGAEEGALLYSDLARGSADEAKRAAEEAKEAVAGGIAGKKVPTDLQIDSDSSLYKYTFYLVNENGEVVGTKKTIDLPLESVVVGGEYDDATRQVILTLDNGETIAFSVADLVDGLVSTSDLTVALADKLDAKDLYWDGDTLSRKKENVTSSWSPDGFKVSNSEAEREATLGDGYFKISGARSALFGTPKREIQYDSTGILVSDLEKHVDVLFKFPELSETSTVTLATLDDIPEVDQTTFAKLGITIPECPAYPIWLCDDSTDEYQTTIGQNNATCTLSYADFLALYFDVYITKHADRYSVTKKSLGRDSANQYDIYEYTFTPKRYSRTVMLSGGMNACELPAEFGIAYLIKNVMEKTDDSFAWLHDNVRFKIIPVICPWSFDQSPMVYENYNGVNLNKNFDYNHCWEKYSAGGAGTKGDAPCSEAETKMLLRWVNANANNCDLWIDCHTDSAGIAEEATAYLHTVICSDSATTSKIALAQSAITQAYIAAGYFESGAEKTETATWTEAGDNYPKTLYARHICGIPSIMVEQYVGNPYYGGTKTIANTSADINNYVTMLRAYVLAVLEREAIEIKSDDIAWYIYQSMRADHYLVDDTEAETPDGNLLTFTHGGLNGNGTFSTATYRAHSDFIEVPESGVFTVTNMSGYELVDLGVYEEDKATFRELTTYYTKTVSGNDWVFTMNIFATYYPTGKYIVFSVKRTDEPYGTIDLADFADVALVSD